MPSPLSPSCHLAHTEQLLLPASTMASTKKGVKEATHRSKKLSQSTYAGVPGNTSHLSNMKTNIFTNNDESSGETWVGEATVGEKEARDRSIGEGEA